ncbi:hypothetical protein P170DRAFT_428027 [Aspergillus steynii IBT 23096]|uniref:Uncharacterized protein n=1 Tax=Aspergillus steynii IBT 23096 TaxID=1392250 RepID=A0A2I2G1I1_9EURO|nr:uncharacterized protein P170DRAFT_428027 [Aspergillus steynii IBT 23096]PLB46734.1 hypothetical protein P170DRAFT_428027 [Aspergillus steynii IBT 23096]
MSNPADLPPELFSAVLDLALQDESDVRRLCGLSLLSRRWYTAVLSRIYSEWTFNGARQSFMTLWNFLRTMRRNPNLATLVRTLHIGNWGFFDHAYTPCHDLQLPSDELELVRKAVHDAGIGHLESSILESLPKRDRRPLMALLLTCLPNLSTVYAHVPRSDPVLYAVLEQANIQQKNGNPSSALCRIEEMYLLQEVPVFPRMPEQDSDEDSEYSDEERLDEELDVRRRSSSLRFDGLWPILQLPSLRTIRMYDVDTDKALLRLPSALKSFSFHWRDDIWDEDVPVITKPDVWKCLLAQKLSLEMIDCYCDGFMSIKRGRFGLLRDFPNLKHVSLEVETLLGGCDDDLIQVPFLPKETLPPKLESSTLYGFKNYDITPELPEQLQELVSSDFPCLRSIVLENGGSIYGNESGEIKASYQALERKCKESGVEFRIQQGNQLRRGGICRDLWEKTLFMQDDGNERAEWFGFVPKRFRDLRELLLRPADSIEEDDDDDLDSRDEWGPYGAKPGRPTRVKVHTVPFTDHSGKIAYMVFQNLVELPLPPLFSFAIYFTHADAAPEHVDMTGLYDQLTSGPEIDVRFDLYFLPGASQEDSTRSRSGWSRDAIATRSTRPPGTTGQLPGMVYKYHGMSPYRGLLYICPERNWRDGQLTVDCVSFDPRATSKEHDPVQVRTRPLSNDSPIFDDDDDFRHNVSQEMFEMAHWKRDDALGPWQKATSWGWSTW